MAVSYSKGIKISIHALLAESDPVICFIVSVICLFLSTLSLRRATLYQLYDTYAKVLFLSTLSLRRATLAGPSGPAFLYNFYPRSPCGERPLTPARMSSRLLISIHALLAESDGIVGNTDVTRSAFLSTLSLRRATELAFLAINPNTFLSTLSLRRATYRGPGTTQWVYYFYPRSPCGERLGHRGLSSLYSVISIHALLAESDFGHRGLSSLYSVISIHALLAESDAYGRINDISRLIFLSTLSLRRATYFCGPAL